jgi:hypothetical protein
MSKVAHGGLEGALRHVSEPQCGATDRLLNEPRADDSILTADNHRYSLLSFNPRSIPCIPNVRSPPTVINKLYGIESELKGDSYEQRYIGRQEKVCLFWLI